MAFGLRVDVLMEDVEGDLCNFFCAGMSAAGSRLVSPVLSRPAVDRSTAGVRLGIHVPPESQSSLLELFEALDSVVLPPRPLLFTAFEFVRIGMAATVSLPHSIQQLSCAQHDLHQTFVCHSAITEQWYLS